jgi:hypothetical protein
VVVLNPMFKKPDIESRFFCSMGNASREGGAAKMLERRGRGARPAWVAFYAGPVSLCQWSECFQRWSSMPIGENANRKQHAAMLRAVGGGQALSVAERCATPAKGRRLQAQGLEAGVSVAVAAMRGPEMAP